jgi:zinc/manganese transport system ATP-binding protein
VDNDFLGNRKISMAVSVVLENVTISYARHPAVHHISGTFEEGSLTAVTGPNGAGKSTLLKGIAGLLPPDEGHIYIHGTKIERVAYLPQASEVERDFPLSVLHLVATGYWYKTGGWGAITADMQRRASEVLQDVGLHGFERRSLLSLSAGQFQRALFARLLVQDASLILLDEPFTAVDAETTNRLLEIIKRWHGEGRTVICVLHDFEQIRRHFPRCLLLARECLAWESSISALNSERLQQARFFHDHWGSQPEICKQAI